MDSGRTYGKELAERPRAVAQEALNPERLRSTALPGAEVGHVSNAATRNGAIGAAAASAMSGAAVFAANALSPKFRGALGVSGKLALVVTPTAGAFFLRSHQTIHEAIKDPEGFVAPTVAAAAANAPANAPSQSALAPWQSAANSVYTHPFKTIMGIAGPIYGGLFYHESTAAATAILPLSQRLIHTRVYGQMVAVLSTVGVMAFAKTMEGSGGIYRIEGGKLVRGEAPVRRRWYEQDGHSAQEREAARLQEEQQLAVELQASRKDGTDLLVPLLYAPLLPLMRIAGRGRIPPERLNMMMLGTIGLALSHAGYIMFSDSTVIVKKDD